MRITYVGGLPKPRGPVDRLKGWTYSQSAPIEVGIMVGASAAVLSVFAALQSWGVVDAMNQILGG